MIKRLSENFCPFGKCKLIECPRHPIYTKERKYEVHYSLPKDKSNCPKKMQRVIDRAFRNDLNDNQIKYIVDNYF